MQTQRKGSKMVEVLLSVARIAAAAYVGICLLVFCRQGSFVYYPQREVQLTPDAADMAYEDVRLETSDGETIAAWHVPARPDVRRGLTVLFSHGNAGNLGHRVQSVRTFHDLGMDVLIYDYRGYGDSTGKPSEKGTYRDGEAAWKYLVEEKGVPPSDIIVFGRSLGGAIAAWLAEKHTPRALVLESAFTSAPDMARRMLPLFPVRLLCRFRYDTHDRLSRISCPVLVAHGPRDGTVPFSHGEKLFKAAREPKRFVSIRGDHNDGGMDYDTAYQRALVEFLSDAEKQIAPGSTDKES